MKETGGAPLNGFSLSLQDLHVEYQSLSDVPGVSSRLQTHPSYGLVLDWLNQFIAQPHTGLGRKGHVCPFVAPALHYNTVRLISIGTKHHTPQEAFEKGLPLVQIFMDLFGGKPEFRTAALLAVFPDLESSRAAAFIDEGHQLLRMHFVRHGLMIGEFHPTSDVGSVHNPRFHVMRSPTPMFAVRALSVHDLMFLDRPDRAPEQRVRYLELYLHHLADQLGPAARADAERRIHSARTLAGDVA